MDRALDRALLWFRRDLRADDHAALYHALRAARQVWCLFVFDRDILDALPRRDRRVEFIHHSLDPGASGPDAGSYRIHVFISGQHRNLGSGTSFPGNASDFNGSILNFRNLQFEEPLDQTRMRP